MLECIYYPFYMCIAGLTHPYCLQRHLATATVLKEFYHQIRMPSLFIQARIYEFRGLLQWFCFLCKHKYILQCFFPFSSSLMIENIFKYGNSMGYQVFNGGIQNEIDFLQKINIFKDWAPFLKIKCYKTC